MSNAAVGMEPYITEARVVISQIINNISDPIHPGQDENDNVDFFELYETSKVIRNIFLPTIVIIGVTGNTIAIIVFMSVFMKHSSSKSFLTTLALVDNLFLIVLFITWFDGSIANIIRTEALCQAVVYVTYVTSFLSVWCVVGFTTDRYIAICHQLKAPIMCSNFREKLAVLVFTIFGVSLYSFALFTTSVGQTMTNGTYRCTNKLYFMDFLRQVTWVDTMITMVIPFTLILVMNLKVVCKAGKFHQKRKQLLQPSKSNDSPKLRALRSKAQMRVTRTLLLVSTTFLILNLPSHVMRLYGLIINATAQASQEIQIYHYIAQEVTQLLYYSTFSVNFFLYALYGKHFQTSLKLMFKSIKNRCICSQNRFLRCESSIKETPFARMYLANKQSTSATEI